MHLTGLKTFVIAGMLAFAGGAMAQAAPTAASATTTATTATAPAAKASPAAAADAAKPADPTLNADGSEKIVPTPHIGQPTDGWIELQNQFSPNGQEAHWFHNWILVPMMFGISLLVVLLLGWVVLRYRRSVNPVASKTSHNTVLEVAWTAIPVLILVIIAVPSIRLLANQYKPAPADAVTLKAIGNQWFWEYEYPDNGVQLTANLLKECKDVAPGQRCRKDSDGPRLLAVDNRVVLPVGREIRLITTSRDVIHSWAMPAFWIKLDAVPGRLNETTFKIEKPGVYFGQCSELCGAYHGFMPIAVEAVPEAEYEAWIKSKGGTLKPAGKADAPAAGADASAAASNATDAGNSSDMANLASDADI